MPWWGWVIIFVVLTAIMAPIKMKIFKKIINKKEEQISDEDA